MNSESIGHTRSGRRTGAGAPEASTPDRRVQLTSRCARPSLATRMLASGSATLAILVAGTVAGCTGSDDSGHPTRAGGLAATPAFASAPEVPRGAGEPEWGPTPETFPPGAELAIYQGDPSEPGAVFTLRLRMPNGYVFPPHFHPEDEHVTVVQGKFLVGLGNVIDEASAVASLGRGGFITAPKLHNHWAIARGVTVVQVHGIGPFQTTFVDENGDAITR